MGGVLDFFVFEDAKGTPQEIFAAMAQSLPHKHRLDIEVLRSLGSRPLDEAAFFGTWYDLHSGLCCGRAGTSWRTARQWRARRCGSSKTGRSSNRARRFP
jgi:hypothetical protein